MEKQTILKKQIQTNFGFTRKCGVLMPISALPSKYGIGSFGKPCFSFIDFLAKSGQSCWQVLPLNPTSYGDSPYQSPSSFAGNPYFIDLEIIYEKGLITKKDLLLQRRNAFEVDYGNLFETRIKILKKAFTKFVKTDNYFEFEKQNAFWLDAYAKFMALKEKYAYAPFNKWNKKDKKYKKQLTSYTAILNEIDFYKFVQYEFFCQWQKVLSYAHERGVQIMGDMPIYVAYDSSDVWSNPSEFLLDENLKPTLVAGVPPDAFSDEGQLWGNPIYNYENMRKNKFSWWVKRFQHAKKMYDLIRVDHFRGFAGYYVINAGEETAKNGCWKQGVGKELFDVVLKKCKPIKIVAEDLGVITKDVYELLDYTGFPSMKVLQFAFGEEDSMYLPKNYKNENCIVYTGTHDSDTTFGWLQSISNYERQNFLKATDKAKGKSDVEKLIYIALSSKANLAIIPMQDYLELDSSARTNTPSKSQGNWVWIAPKGYNHVCSKLLKIAKKTCRI